MEVSPPDAAAALLAWHGPEAPTQVWLCDLDAGADYRAALAVVSARPVTVAVHDASVLLNQSRQMFDSGSALLPNPGKTGPSGTRPRGCPVSRRGQTWRKGHIPVLVR